MLGHNIMFSLTVSPETLAAMSYDEFMEFWTAYGKIIRLLSKVRLKLNEEEEEF